VASKGSLFLAANAIKAAVRGPASLKEDSTVEEDVGFLIIADALLGMGRL
jgi:hypothetical protein